MSATKEWKGAEPFGAPIVYSVPKEVADPIEAMCEAGYPKTQLEHEQHAWRRWKAVVDKRGASPEMAKAFGRFGAANAAAARITAERCAEAVEGAYVPAEPEEREYDKQRITQRVSSNEHVEAEPLEPEEHEAEKRAPARRR